MITLAHAINIVNEKLESFSSSKESAYEILPNETLETDDYWVFFYNSSQYIRTGDLSHALAGNAPFIIDKYEGQIYVTGTAHSVTFYMQAFEKNDLPKIKGRQSR